MKALLSLLIMLLPCIASAQAKATGNKSKTVVREWKAGAMAYRGILLNHNNSLAPMVKSPETAGELYLSWQTFGKNRRDVFYNYPEYGVSYAIIAPGTRYYTKELHCFFPHVTFRLLNNANRMNVNFRLGAGLAYTGKKYDPQDNPLNKALGTHLNATLSARLTASYKIDDRWTLLAGAGMIHVSNGSCHLPNAGVNIAEVSSGLSYSFVKSERLILTKRKDYYRDRDRDWEYNLLLLGGIKEISPIGGNKYFAGDISLEVTRKHLSQTRLGASLDIVYDMSDYYAIIQSGPEVSKPKTVKLGISGGYVLMLGGFSINAYVGAYLYAENTIHGRLYQQTSLRYPLSDRMDFSISFRNHKGRADHIGLGCAIRL